MDTQLLRNRPAYIVDRETVPAMWAVQKFQKFIVTEARTNGLSPERLGEAVHAALSTAKPKARYAVIPQRFTYWTLPRLLPVRMLDAQLAKMLGLAKP